MEILISPNRLDNGAAAALRIAELIRRAVQQRDAANIILATGASQFEMLSYLVSLPGIDWSKVTAFHLDEYIGLPITHPASFRKYLQERFVAQLPTLGRFHFVNGEVEPLGECRRLGEWIRRHPVDVACIGIGENGHLAFNDPPADFDTEEPYIVVNLDAACRRQQVGEGWFATLEDVPRQAISMSIRQIMKSAAIVCTVPDERKAVAVKKAVTPPVTNLLPATVLQQHPLCWLYVDEPAAALLAHP